MNQRRLLLLLLCSAATLAACQSDEIRVNDPVNSYTVTREDLPINVKEGGELVAVKETVVRSLIEGQATILWLIPEGTQVKVGDKLVELDVSSLVEKRASQEIAVEKARNALDQARTQQQILEKELITKKNTADSQRQIAAMELHKLLGAQDGSGSEGKNGDMVRRLEELVTAPVEHQPTAEEIAATAEAADEPAIVIPRASAIAPVYPQNYAGLVKKVIELLRVSPDEDPLERDMGEMANKILQQADQIRLAMADLKNKEDTVAFSRRLAAKQFITRNELDRDELAYQSQASKVTIAWNDLELLVNYTLERDKIELTQNLANAELEVERVLASNGAERKNSEVDVAAKQKEFEVETEQLQNLVKQIGNSFIYSPGEGLVVYSSQQRGRGDSEAMEEGTSVRERQSIIILPDNSVLQCVIKVQEAMVGLIKLGMAAHVSVEARPNEVLTGRVTYIAPVADSASRWGGNDKKVYTTNVLLDGVNSDDGLKAGMKAAATITVTTVPDVLTVPIQCVRRDRAVNYVWKSTANGPVAVPVQVGANNQEKVEVTAGLSAGDKIYRTPPGGEADPKFDQPELPEVPEVPPSKLAETPPNGDTIPAAGTNGDGPARSGNRGGRGGMFAAFQKKLADMTPEELANLQIELDKSAAMVERIRESSPERADAMAMSVDAIRTALAADDLPAAQTAIDAMMGSMAAMMRRRGDGANGGPQGGSGAGGRRDG